MEQADIADLKSAGVIREGSNPSSRTNTYKGRNKKSNTWGFSLKSDIQNFTNTVITKRRVPCKTS